MLSWFAKPGFVGMLSLFAKTGFVSNFGTTGGAFAPDSFNYSLNTVFAY